MKLGIVYVVRSTASITRKQKKNHFKNGTYTNVEISNFVEFTLRRLHTVHSDEGQKAHPTKAKMNSENECVPCVVFVFLQNISRNEKTT